MRQAGNNRTHRLLLLSGALLFLISLPGILFFLGSRTEGISTPFGAFTVDFDKGREAEKWMSHERTEYPLGDNYAEEDGFTRHHEFTIRIPKGVLNFDLKLKPRDRIRKQLPNSVRGLVEVLASDDAARVFCAAEALGEKKGAAVSALPKLLEVSGRYFYVFQFMEKITAEAKEEAVSPLVAGLSTTNLQTIECSTMLLGTLGTNAIGAVDSLFALFPKVPPDNQATIALALWKITGDCEKTLPVLRRHLAETLAGNTSPHLIFVIGSFGAEAGEAVPELIKVVEQSPKDEAVIYAIDALGKIGKKAEIAVPAIARSVRGGRFNEGERVMGALAQFGAAGMPVLIEYYQSTNSNSSFKAARALAKIGPPAAKYINIYIEDLKGGDMDRAIRACEIVSKLGNLAAPAVPHLERLLFQPKIRLRAHAASALSELNERSETALYAAVEVMDVLFLRDPYHSMALATIDRILKRAPQLKVALERKLQVHKRAALVAKRRWKL